MLADMKGKVHNIRGVELLYSRVPPDQLDLPDFVMDYDERVSYISVVVCVIQDTFVYIDHVFTR